MKNIKNIFSVLFVSLLLSSCAEEFIDTEPTTAKDASQIITDIASAESAVNGLYDRFQQIYISGGYNAFMPGLYADELRHSGSFPSFAEFGANDVSLNNVNNTSFWTDHYETINAANIIIDKLEEIEIDAESAARFDAQAKAVRAYLYYNLVKLYGGVPLSLDGNTSATQIDSNPLPRSSASEVYSQIMMDLEDALAGISGGSIYFFNENSVRVLKATVEMEMEMYSQAEETIEPVIGAYSLASSYDDLFTGTANGQEAILAIEFSDFDGSSYAFFYLQAGGRYEVAPRGTLLAAFEEGDLRTNQILNFGVEDAAPQIFKFKDPGSGSDDAYIYRYSHALLIYAELLARRDDPSASTFLNMVRERAGLEPKEINSSNVEEVIAQERFVEFYGENTDRLFTIKRLGLADDVISSKPNSVFIPERDNLWPIPQQEIERNSAISTADQNPGY